MLGIVEYEYVGCDCIVYECCSDMVGINEWKIVVVVGFGDFVFVGGGGELLVWIVDECGSGYLCWIDCCMGMFFVYVWEGIVVCSDDDVVVDD